MKLRILNYRIAATHELVSPLNSLREPVSISDFDAFVYDPAGLNVDSLSAQVFQRRQMEIRDLIHRKGGVVICILRPNTNPEFGAYVLLDTVGSNGLGLLRSTVKEGEGSQLRIIQSARGASAAYFQVLKGTLRFAAHLETSESAVSQQGGTVFAVDSAGYPIAVEFSVGEGRICFVPPPNNIPADRMGAAIVKVMIAHFSKSTEIDAPAWAAGITVPRADIHDEAIAELTKRMEELALEIGVLKNDRDNLLKYVRLLFGSGKAILEPVVRSAFRLLGFAVPEPEEYAGEWDVELRIVQSTRTALGEIEGSEGLIDVDKYRQLLDYIEAESLEGREHKGILVGNGFRLLSPDAAERQGQFSDHAQRGAARNGFCLLPTTELFKAVCAVLESPQDESLKAAIRESLFAAVGPWSFARERAVENKSSMTPDQISATPST